MRLLLLDTCGTEATLALADTGLADPLIASSRLPGRTASERLVAVLREAMADAEWKLRDLAAIAVVTGPGSFTGVRVGLSVAKGLSEASGVPIIALSRLAVLAAVSSEARVCALLDAGRAEFYCGQYPGSREALLSREGAIEAASKAAEAVACENAVVKALAGQVSVLRVAEPTAAAALPLALQRLAEASFDGPMTLDANYLRRTDAEIFAKPAAGRG